MSLWAIIPVKPLNLARSELETALDRQGREALATANLRQALEALTRSWSLAGVVVLSRDSRARRGAQLRRVHGDGERRAGAERRADAGDAHHADVRRDSPLMLAADLPLIGPEDLEALARLGECSSRLVVASPDRFEDGTNALLMRPPGVIPYALGPGSFKRHVARARRRSRRPAEELGQPVTCPVCWSWRPVSAGEARRVFRYAV